MMAENEVREGGLGWQSKHTHPKLTHTNKEAERTALLGKLSYLEGGIITPGCPPEVMTLMNKVEGLGSSVC